MIPRTDHPRAAAVPPIALFTVAEALNTVGFNNVESAALNAESFPTIGSFKGITEADIKTIEVDYGKRAIANGRIIFGFDRTKLLTGLMHWMQDQWRKGLIPEEEGPVNLDNLTKAFNRCRHKKEHVRLHQKQQTQANKKSIPTITRGSLDLQITWEQYLE
jgi:hypothetical protein